MDLWIFDIDGVVAEPQHRLPMLKRGDHKRFYLMIPRDTPIQSGISLYNLSSQSNSAVFATGRPEWTKDMTEQWMFRNMGIGNPSIYYRKNGDYRPSPLIKVREVAEILKANSGKKFNNIYFVDDYPPNVRAVEEAFPKITGIIFKTERLDERPGRTEGRAEGVGNNSFSII